MNFVRQLKGNISLGRHWLDGRIILSGVQRNKMRA
jgi:hypothetical protein